MSDKAIEQLRSLIRPQVQRNGPYVLASGAESDWYLDCRPVTFTFPRDVARAFIEMMDDRPIDDPDPGQPLTFAGVAVAGVPIATALASAPWAMPVYGMGIRPEPKDHGVGGCVMGIPMGDRPKVVIVDDVFTSGGSLRKAADRLREEWNIEPAAYMTLFNRNADRQDWIEFEGKPFRSVFGLEDVL